MEKSSGCKVVVNQEGLTLMRSNKTHPWELVWREEGWAETSPPLPVVVNFAEDLKREGAKKVLDLGCGPGRHSILLGKTGFQVVALDVSETALKTLEGRLRVLPSTISRSSSMRCGSYRSWTIISMGSYVQTFSTTAN